MKKQVLHVTSYLGHCFGITAVHSSFVLPTMIADTVSYCFWINGLWFCKHDWLFGKLFKCYPNVHILVTLLFVCVCVCVWERERERERERELMNYNTIRNTLASRNEWVWWTMATTCPSDVDCYEGVELLFIWCWSHIVWCGLFGRSRSLFIWGHRKLLESIKICVLAHSFRLVKVFGFIWLFIHSWLPSFSLTYHMIFLYYYFFVP